MNQTYYNVNFDECFESNPCQHHVTITENTDTFGSPVTYMWRAPEILKLIREGKCKVKYTELDHFRKYFTKEDEQMFYQLYNDRFNNPSLVGINALPEYCKQV